MSTSKKRESRNMLHRAQEIFKIINNEENFFPKSRLKEAKLHSKAIDTWLELIAFIQSQPRIRIRKMNSSTPVEEKHITSRFNTFVERIETNYSQTSMKRFFNESLPLEARLQSLTDYAKTIFRQELLVKAGDVNNWESTETGLLSLYDDVGTLTSDIQGFALKYLKEILPEIEELINLYQKNAEKGHDFYIALIKQKTPALKIIARGLRDQISLGMISPRLRRNALPQEFIIRQFSPDEEESFLTGYLSAMLSLVYCVIKGYEGQQFLGTPIQRKCMELVKSEDISTLSSLLDALKNEIKELTDSQNDL